MPIMYYSIIVAMIFFSMIAMLVCVNTSGTLSRNNKKYFRLLFISVAVTTFCEWLGVCLQGTGHATRVLHIIIKAAELSIAPAISLLVVAVIERHFKKIVLFFLSVHCCLEILSGIFGFIYKVDANSMYTHERFYWIYIAAYFNPRPFVNTTSPAV